ncbi:MAG: cupin domain-containing protein [Candidatus Saccharimonadales bacterium]|nr:cupin domain-containing protein [Candidatus Saccharimonadales bacterium]
MKYVYSEDEADSVSKFGINLKIYGDVTKDINFVRANTEVGHLEEFKNTSTFIYYILEGEGVFVLNDEKVPVKASDLVVIPPNTRIHYFGKMDYTLIVNPPWREENETHIRDVDPSESPL